MNDFVPALKDRAMFLAWVAALVLVASLLWFFTFSFRMELLMKVTNKTLHSMNDQRTLAAPLPHRSAGLGCWYSIDESDTLFYVFAILREGILVPCGAEISRKGEVIEIIPLGNHARQVIGRIPQSYIQVYARRIEASAAGVAFPNSAASTGGLGE